jgi:chaperone modulatory protein CbpM
MTISRSEFLSRVQTDDGTLDVWVVEEWLLPQRVADEVVFSEADLARARLILELQEDLGVNREGIGIILNLLDQLHSLRNALAGKVKPPNE